MLFINAGNNNPKKGYVTNDQMTSFQMRFNFVTKMTLSFWSKEAVAKRPSLSGLQSTQFTGWSDIWGQGKLPLRLLMTISVQHRNLFISTYKYLVPIQIVQWINMDNQHRDLLFRRRGKSAISTHQNYQHQYIRYISISTLENLMLLKKLQRARDSLAILAPLNISSKARNI